MIGSPTLLIDTREQAPFEFSDRVWVQRATLDAGDYSVAGLTATVAIERKSADDLAQSVTHGRERFLACCSRLAKLDFATIVVECSLEDIRTARYRSRTNPQSIIGTMLAIHVDYGVPTIWAGSRSSAANVTERLLTRLWRNAIAAGEVAA
jgi:ERCC4-type nuclease